MNLKVMLGFWENTITGGGEKGENEGDPNRRQPSQGTGAKPQSCSRNASVCLVFLGKDFVVKRFQIHKGYAARFTPRLTQKSTAQPLAFLLHGYG
jgi:hypothetical protein